MTNNAYKHPYPPSRCTCKACTLQRDRRDSKTFPPAVATHDQWGCSANLTQEVEPTLNIYNRAEYLDCVSMSVSAKYKARGSSDYPTGPQNTSINRYELEASSADSSTSGWHFYHFLRAITAVTCKINTEYKESLTGTSRARYLSHLTHPAVMLKLLLKHMIMKMATNRLLIINWKP